MPDSCEWCSYIIPAGKVCQCKASVKIRDLEKRRERLLENSKFLGEKCEGLAKELSILRGALNDIANENTGIDPALFAYAVLNPE